MWVWQVNSNEHQQLVNGEILKFFPKVSLLIMVDSCYKQFSVMYAWDSLVSLHKSHIMRKPTFWFPTWSDTNQAVQLQKRLEILDFGLHYLCSENKGANQLRGNREADLRLCFCIMQNVGFLVTWLIRKMAIPQLCSSDPSVQSNSWSQTQDLSIHAPSPAHLNWSGLHS